MNRFLSTWAAVTLALAALLSGAREAGAQSYPSQTPEKQTQPGQTEGKDSSKSSAPQMSKEEIAILQNLQAEADPDRILQMVNEYEKKYPSSAYLPAVYVKGAAAYQQKGDLQHGIEYGEKSLKLQGDNVSALLLVASMLPDPKSLRGSDADKDKKLGQASDYSNRALQLLDRLPKRPEMTEDQFKQIKGSVAASAHSSLGLVHLQKAGMSLTGPDKAELAKAQEEYKQAVALTPQPEPSDYYRLGEAYAQDGKTDDAIAAYTKASEMGAGTALKKLADDQIEALRKSKPPAQPAKKP